MDKKVIFIVLVILAICLIYQLFFRYEYKIYKGNNNNAFVVKLDKLTGKSEVREPLKKDFFTDLEEKIERREKVKKLWK